MSKQDGAYPRSAADLERKYNFGKSFADVFGLANDARDAANEANAAVEKLDELLTSEEVFNRLTNYGKVQGIYRGDDGDIYVNATYIKSGTLSAERIEASSITLNHLSQSVKDAIKNAGDDVPSYIKSTYIDSVTIKSPTIEANEFNVQPDDETDYTGSFNIFGMQLEEYYHMLAIAYQGYNNENTPYVDYYSPDGAELRFNYANQHLGIKTCFYGKVDFSKATVSGLGGSSAGSSLEGTDVDLYADDDITIEAGDDVLIYAGDMIVRFDAGNERINFYFGGSDTTWYLDADGLREAGS